MDDYNDSKNKITNIIIDICIAMDNGKYLCKYKNYW